jgi:hypothetical protein
MVFITHFETSRLIKHVEIRSILMTGGANILSDTSPVKVGLKQRDALSTLLFQNMPVARSKQKRGLKNRVRHISFCCMLMILYWTQLYILWRGAQNSFNSQQGGCSRSE